jgi:hypothetical protein
VTICYTDATVTDIRYSPPTTTHAVSESASSMMRKIEDAYRSLLETSLGVAYRVGRQRVVAAGAVATEEGWDGYSARPVDPGAMQYAFRLLSHLPVDMPAPEASVDPDGEVSLEWYRGPRKTFSVSVSATGRLSYAGLFAQSSVHGTEAYFEDELPSEIRLGIRRVFS